MKSFLKTKLTRVAQAVALAALISVPAAHATTVDWGVHDDLETTQQQVGFGSFTDIFTFTLPSFNDLTSVAVSNNLIPLTSIVEGQVTLYEGIPGDATADTQVLQYGFDGSSGDVLHTATNLTGGGSYYYEVTGDAVGNHPQGTAGQYQLTSALAPIPEPEIYAMLAAGLGLMGFVARRRKSQVTAA